MFAGRQDLCRQEAALLDPRHDEWRRRSFRTTDEVPGLLDALAAAMEEHGYPKKDLFAVRLAVEEALVNAIKHGNRNDPSKEAWLRYHVTEERLLVEVEDEGEGFDPDAVPDPLAPENLERPSGRGLFLMRRYMTSVHYNERGNALTMCKERTD